MGIFDKIFGGKKSSKIDVSKRFELDRHAFSGTMSKFRVAKEIGTGKLFGLKFLDQKKLDHFRSRFKGLNKPEEGEIAMQIHHPLIVETYEYGKTEQGQEYILMEYIEGSGLDAIIRSKRQEIVPHRLKMIKQMAQSVQVVHDLGFIHRDVCPRNFICHSNYTGVRLIDFGLTIPDEPPYRLPGNRTGTPQYMAPEIVRRRPTDNRVDVFALGITMYRMLTWEHPWGSTDTSGMAALTHDSAKVTSIFEHRPDLNKKLGEAVHKCMEIKVEDRMPSCKRFLGAIRNVTSETEKDA